MGGRKQNGLQQTRLQNLMGGIGHPEDGTSPPVVCVPGSIRSGTMWPMVPLRGSPNHSSVQSGNLARQSGNLALPDNG